MLTGWFANMNALEDEPNTSVDYANNHMRFAGSTFETTALCRAHKVCDFFKQQGLNNHTLQKQYKAQMKYLYQCFLDLKAPPELIHCNEPKYQAGFLALKSPKAKTICQELKKYNVYTDTREPYIRFGLAPYIQKEQIQEAMQSLNKVIKKLT